jgi:radical SAM superfamily enzyme YgiQ (UPF0313 family)
MKPRILIINPWIYDFAAFNFWTRPLGLLKVAEYLSSYDIDLFYIDCTDSFEVRQYGTGKFRTESVAKPALLKSIPRHYKRYGISIDEFKMKLKSSMPIDLVLMTSIMSYWYSGVQDTIDLVRETAGNVPVILGGIYATLYSDHASSNSGADYIYSGPLREQFLSALQDLGIKAARMRQPVPYYRLSLYPYMNFSPLLTSTGCPFHCSYCASRFLSQDYERSPIQNIIKEIHDLQSQGVRDFVFYDDALLYDSDRHIKPLLKTIIERGFSIRLHAPNGLHARFIDEALAQLMREAGITTIRIGFETANPARQEHTGGKVLTDDLVRSIKSLRKHGFTKEHIGVYLLYGLPGQGLLEVEESIELLQSLNVRIHLAEFSPIRGTACWDDLVKNAIIPDDLDPLLTNNTVFSFLYSGYDQNAVECIKINVKNYNRLSER